MQCNTPVVNMMNMTRYDTVILGHRIPAGTRVFFNLASPSLNRPSVPFAQANRHETSRTQNPTAARQNWDGAAPEEFCLDRWLKEDCGSAPVFDTAAGLALVFSEGNRGCWGKRLGYLERRVVTALLSWSLEFEASEKFSNWEKFNTLVTAPKHWIIRVKDVSYIQH